MTDRDLPDFYDKPVEDLMLAERREVFERAAELGVSEAFTEHMDALAKSIDGVEEDEA